MPGLTFEADSLRASRRTMSALIQTDLEFGTSRKPGLLRTFHQHGQPAVCASRAAAILSAFAHLAAGYPIEGKEHDTLYRCAKSGQLVMGCDDGMGGREFHEARPAVALSIIREWWNR